MTKLSTLQSFKNLTDDNEIQITLKFSKSEKGKGIYTLNIDDTYNKISYDNVINTDSVGYAVTEFINSFVK